MFSPKQICIAEKTYVVANAEDYWRHDVLHYFYGTSDIHQAMVKGNVLFGIDAADCRFSAPFLDNYWQQYLDHYQTHDPASLPVIHDMMRRIALHPDLPERIGQELENAPSPVLEYLARTRNRYSENLQIMHDELIYTLQKQPL